MIKKDAGKPKGPGRPYKGRLKATLRLDKETVDALEKAHAATGRDKSDIAQEAIKTYLGLPRSKSSRAHQPNLQAPPPSASVPEPEVEPDLIIYDEDPGL